MKNTLPLGSIIRINDKSAVIAGYEWYDRDGKSAFSYRIVPFPLGITKPDSLKSVPAEDVEMISPGYQTEFSEHYCTFLDKVRDIGTTCSASELAGYLQEAEKRIAEITKEES